MPGHVELWGSAAELGKNIMTAGTIEHKIWQRDLHMMASYLRQTTRAKVPVAWLWQGALSMVPPTMIAPTMGQCHGTPPLTPVHDLARGDVAGAHPLAAFPRVQWKLVLVVPPT